MMMAEAEDSDQKLRVEVVSCYQEMTEGRVIRIKV